MAGYPSRVSIGTFCLVAFALGGASGCGGSAKRGGRPGACMPQVTNTPSEPTAVNQVDIYWDTSQSMQKTWSKKKGAPNALALLWRNLARTWVRDNEVTQVNQYAVGREIEPLAQVGTTPKLTSDYTNIPEAATKAGELLASSPSAAVVLVSDMIVDRPPQSAGEPVCGQVKAAAGPGRVPAYFGQCLVEPWTTVPPWTTLTGLIVRAVEPALRAPSPLFVMVIARNPSFAEHLVQRIKERLSDESKSALEAQSLVLATHRPSVRCDEISKCSYWIRSDILALHEDEKGSKQCSFRAVANRGDHTLRCTTNPAGAADGGFIRLAKGRAESLDANRLRLARAGDGYLDLKWDLAGWKLGPAKAGLRFAYDWVLAEDMDAQLGDWLGDTGSQSDDYRSTFHTAVSAIHSKLAPPRCSEEWSIAYTR
jgi:hypothetical protein